jgi:CO dehydrogenase nickel-insertion accessory protein CooC1
MDIKDKLVIVINGKGGVGKDTLCEIICEHYNCVNVSSITPIKQIASRYGWNGEKDLKSRRFLSELKRVFSEYNDLPNQYLINEYKSFLNSDNQIMFVHIREKDQIEKFVEGIDGNCITLLITRRIGDNGNGIYGNDADDLVDEFTYDYHYDNSLPLEEAKKDFLEYFNNVIIPKKLS